MLFLWTITKRGKIWLDGDAFRQIVAKRLPFDFYCQEVSFVGDQNLLNIYITLPEQDDPQKRLSLIDKLDEFFRPMGISVHVHWTRRTPEDSEAGMPWWRRPICWAGITGGVTALLNLGLKGFLWTVLLSFAGYIVAWIALSEDGQKMVVKLIKDVKDFRR